MSVQAAIFTADEIFQGISQCKPFTDMMLELTVRGIDHFDNAFARLAIANALHEVSMQVFTHINQETARQVASSLYDPNVRDICWRDLSHSPRVITWNYNIEYAKKIFEIHKALKVSGTEHKPLFEALHLLTLLSMKHAIPHFYQTLFYLEQVEYPKGDVRGYAAELLQYPYFFHTTRKVYEYYLKLIPQEQAACCSLL